MPLDYLHNHPQFADLIGMASARPRIRRLQSSTSSTGKSTLPSPPPGSATEFGKLIAEETEKWAKVVRGAGLKPE